MSPNSGWSSAPLAIMTSRCLLIRCSAYACRIEPPHKIKASQNTHLADGEDNTKACETHRHVERRQVSGCIVPNKHKPDTGYAGQHVPESC